MLYYLFLNIFGHIQVAHEITEARKAEVVFVVQDLVVVVILLSITTGVRRIFQVAASS
jgi:hypothetical protein